jgi:hypothetical protein
MQRMVRALATAALVPSGLILGPARDEKKGGAEERCLPFLIHGKTFRDDAAG